MLLQKSSCFQFAFNTLDISQGSIATHLRCGGIFSDNIVTRLSITSKSNKHNRLVQLLLGVDDEITAALASRVSANYR